MGHISYKCPHNKLGERQKPKKEKKRKAEQKHDIDVG